MPFHDCDNPKAVGEGNQSNKFEEKSSFSYFKICKIIFLM